MVLFAGFAPQPQEAAGQIFGGRGDAVGLGRAAHMPLHILPQRFRFQHLHIRSPPTYPRFHIGHIGHIHPPPQATIILFFIPLRGVPICLQYPRCDCLVEPQHHTQGLFASHN